MKNFTMKIKTSILGAFLAMVLLIVGVIMGVQYKSTGEFALLTTQKSFENISQKVVGQIEKYDTNSNSFISLLKDLKIVETSMKKGKRHPLLKPITQYMGQSNHTYGVYVGYEDDSFYQVINLGVSANIKNLLDMPIKSRWLVRKHLVKNGTITRIEEVLDRELKVIKTTQKPVDYRPSSRPWYKKALKSDSTVKTDPYIFTSLQKPGVTYARKTTQNPKTVIGIDISLESLGKMLSSVKLVDRSGAYIFKKDGTVLGQYDTYLFKEVKNINAKYKNIFTQNNSVKNLNQQKIVKIGGQDFMTYTQKLPSSYNIDENIVVFSSMDSIMKPFKEKIYEVLKYIGIAILLLVIPMIYFVINLIVKPISQLEIENKKIQNGEFDKVKKVSSFMIEINSLSDSLFDMSKAIEQNQRTLELKVEQRTKDIANLLNNAGQGFLSFDSQMVIGQKYSIQAQKIFNMEIAGANIMKLLYPEDEEKQQFITSTLQGILKDDQTKQEILISLLDKEFVINNRNIEVEYKLLPDYTYMLILTDVTTQKELAKEVEKEQQVLKMVVETVTTLEQFLDVKKGYEEFVNGIQNFTNIEYLQTLRNSVHTYKGLFAQKEMLNVVNELHQFESDVDKSIKENKAISSVANMDKATMLEWFEEDMKILKSILGEGFLDQSNKILIDVARIKQILVNIDTYMEENKKLRGIYQDIDKITKEHVKVFVEPYKKLLKAFGERIDKYVEPLEIDYDTIYSDEDFKPFTSQVEGVLSKIDSYTGESDKFQEVYGDLEKLTYHHIKVFLEPYKKLVEQLAFKVEKQISPLNLHYDDLYIDDKYKPFFNSLVHIFRNSVDHGIESFDERYESSKGEYGQVDCIVTQNKNELIISISDDGKGIDIEQLKDVALEKELYTFEELEVMDEKDILMLILKEEFTTALEVTNISGRGVGLTATYAELQKLDGKLVIDNRPKEGITFKFIIPFKG